MYWKDHYAFNLKIVNNFYLSIRRFYIIFIQKISIIK